MPKKIQFTKDDVIRAAFAIFKEEGLEGISARKIAAKLGSSTAPVYSTFNNIEDIKSNLLDMSLQLLLDYTEKEYTRNIFLNIGVGMLEFAKDYRVIYRTLFLENNHYHHVFKEFSARNFLQMKKQKNSLLLGDEDLKGILDKLTVYTHGLAALICAGMLENTSTNYLIRTLLDVGDDIIGATAYRRGKLEEYEALGKGREAECKE